MFINKKWNYKALELRGMTLFRGCVLHSTNCHGKNTTEPTKEYMNNNYCTIWQVPA